MHSRKIFTYQSKGLTSIPNFMKIKHFVESAAQKNSTGRLCNFTCYLCKNFYLRV
jgi:hypothetical protein